MSKKIVFSAIGLIFLASPLVASADTLSDLQNLLQTIKQILSALSVPASSQSAAAAATESTPQDVKILTLLLTFSNTSPNVGFEQWTRDVLFGSGQSLKSLVEKASYGTAHVSGAVEGWYQVPFALTANEQCPYQEWISSADTIAQSHGIDLNQYTHIVYLFSDRGDDTTTAGWRNCPGSGWAIYAPNTPYKRVVAAAPSLIRHELLHQLGQGKEIISHANGLDCGVQSITANYLSSCHDQDYGDPFDVLGSGENVANLGVDGALFNLPHRIEAGWLAPSRTPEITADGIYTINQIDALTGVVGLKIKKPDSDPRSPFTSNDYYYIEYFPTQYAQGKYVTGVTLRIWPGTPYSPLLMDMTPRSCYPPMDPGNPNSCFLSDWHDGFLGDGKTFTDNNGIQITQISHTNTSATVKIDLSHRPILVSDKQAYQGGDTISASWSNLDTTYSNDWVGLVMSGGKWTDYTGSRAKMWFYTGGAKNGTKTVVVPNLINGPTGPRYWQLAYFPKDGYDELMRSVPISVSYNPAFTPSITTDKNTYAAGEPIIAHWMNPDHVNTKDWVGAVIENKGWSDYTGSRAKMWFYTGDALQGSGTIAAPAVPGRYQLAYFPNDKFDITLRGSVFNVLPPPPPVDLSWPSVPDGYYKTGDSIPITWKTDTSFVTSPKDWVGIIPAGANPAGDAWAASPDAKNRWFYTDGAVQGTKNLTAPMAGTYELVYFKNDGFTEIGRSRALGISGNGSIDSVSGPSTVPAGTATQISWNKASVMAKDWITFVPAGQSWVSGNPWVYTDGATKGSKSIVAPALPGTYDLVYYVNDGNTEALRTRGIQVTNVMFALTPVKQIAKPDSTLAVSWYVSGETHQYDWVTLVPQGQKWAEPYPWFYTDAAKLGMKTFKVPTTPGVYDLVYFANNNPGVEMYRISGVVTITQ